jgi:hypothetical protein
VIEEVAVTVEGDTEWCEVHVRWAGGSETRGRLRRPVARLEQLGDAEELHRRVRELKAEGLSAARIAEGLNRDGLRTTDGQPFTSCGARRLLSRYGLTRPRPHKASNLGPGEWLIPELAKHVGVPLGTVYGWARRGVVASRLIREDRGGNRLLIVGLGDQPDLESIKRGGSLKES